MTQICVPPRGIEATISNLGCHATRRSSTFVVLGYYFFILLFQLKYGSHCAVQAVCDNVVVSTFFILISTALLSAFCFQNHNSNNCYYYCFQNNNNSNALERKRKSPPTGYHNYYEYSWFIFYNVIFLIIPKRKRRPLSIFLLYHRGLLYLSRSRNALSVI